MRGIAAAVTAGMALLAAPCMALAGQVPALDASAQEIRWPIAVSEDKRRLVDASGRQFLLIGDTAWSLLAALPKDDTLRYLDDRAARGVNAILVNLIEHRYSPHAPPWRNAEGHLPFADPDDFPRIEEAYFRHVDWVIARARERGIALLLLPAYIGINCGDQGWCAEMRRNGSARLRAYGDLLGRRYGGADNLLWVHGGDHTPADADFGLVAAIRDGIIAGGGARQLHLYHWNSGSLPSADLRIGRIDVDTLYSYGTGRLGRESLAVYEANRGRRPFLFIEGFYENEHRSTASVWREQFYATTLMGGAGFVFGNFPIWPFWNPGDPNYGFGDDNYRDGWRQALDGQGSRLLAIAARFFRTLGRPDLRPDPNSLLLAEEGALTAGAQVTTARSPDGSLAVSYLPAPRTITVDTTRLPGAVEVSWFDPSTGLCAPSQRRLPPNAGRVALAPPGPLADRSGDWLLLLEVLPPERRSRVCG